MRSPLEPNVLEVAILAGWTAYGALRERVEQLRARFAGRTVEPEPVEASPPTVAVLSARPRQVDYSIN
jgi:hypothetical protein